MRFPKETPGGKSADASPEGLTSSRTPGASNYNLSEGRVINKVIFFVGFGK